MAKADYPVKGASGAISSQKPPQLAVLRQFYSRPTESKPPKVVGGPLFLRAPQKALCCSPERGAMSQGMPREGADLQDSSHAHILGCSFRKVR